MIVSISIGFIRDESAIEINMDLIFGLLMGAAFIWVLGFIFCAVLLLPLIPIFQRTSLSFSFLLFSIIGFCIPAYLGYLFSIIPSHGEMPVIYKDDNIQTILSIIYGGLVGVAGSVSAWYSLKRDTVN